MGALRALHDMDLMKEVDAISAVSGGSWGTGIYMFAKDPLHQLLGTPTNPANLTLEVLRQDPPTLGAVVTHAHGEVFHKMYIGGEVRENEVWQRMIDETMLAPFGLNEHRFLAQNQEQVNDIIRRNPRLDGEKFAMPAEGRPRVYVIGGALLAPVDYQSAVTNIVNLQISPDFTGTPYRPNGTNVSYMGKTAGNGLNISLTYPVGGGLVETFAFGGASPSENQDGTCPAGGCTLPIPRRSITLGDALGISSLAYGKAFTSHPVLKQVLSHREVVAQVGYWPILKAGEQPNDDSRARLFQVGDGGNIENSGLLAMLQRRATKIVWWINAYKDLGIEADACNKSVPEADIVAGVVDQVIDKFGLGHYSPDFITNNQVFDTNHFRPVVCELQGKVRNGQPGVVRRKNFQVLENTWWGIVPYKIDIVMVYLTTVSDFEKALPEETQDVINKGRRGLDLPERAPASFSGLEDGKDVAQGLNDIQYSEFANFPIYMTLANNGNTLKDFMSLSGSQVNLLSAQSEYVVKQNAETFENVLKLE